MSLTLSPPTWRWLIGGHVQGVGFRPFVCRLARELGLSGSVRNHGGGVEILAACDGVQATVFVQRLLTEHPPIANPDFLSTTTSTRRTGAGFHILPSTGGGPAMLLPDQSVCPACLAEMADRDAVRFRYPFITCTQCGPRYSISEATPFDRATTGMAGFPLCAACRAEYENPADRRFHAQVMACPQCGPRLWFSRGPQRTFGNDSAMAAAIVALRGGEIVAVKGIGGYHLLCDAANDTAVQRLRRRKQRPTKALAVLFADLADVRRHCAPTAAEAASLASPERPIVLVRRNVPHTLAAALAPGLPELGALLPYAPLHHSLITGCGFPLVATSANRAGEPVAIEEAAAERSLGDIADAFLHHDRPILQPADDGVVRVIAHRPRRLRLGRGSAPLERTLPHRLSMPALALGGQMKTTVALGFGGRVVISPHVGDLDSPAGMECLQASANALQRLLGVRAKILICDSHGGYSATRWARAQDNVTVLPIPHHQAHAAALAGEYAGEARFLCFTWDGIGLGEDGTLWGGEALLGRPGAWRRVATFRPFAPPGGEKAAREPWRSAAALAWELGLEWQPPGLDVGLAHQAWQQRINSPVTSSVGRLFDAAAAFLHLVPRASHEGEAPMALEALAATACDPPAAVALPLRRRADGVCQADWAPLIPMLRDDVRPPAQRAAMLHASLARTLVDQAIAIRRAEGDFAVGLAGGVFQNRLLSEQAMDRLARAGFRAYLPLDIPCNDAGLSFGQMIEAAARLR